jgi:tetratricopeptide (TPR) repeat protein
MKVLAARVLLATALLAAAGVAQQSPAPRKAADSLLQKFLAEFDLPAASHEADSWLQRNQRDAIALTVRMEAAELQEQPEIVLDSALRLCALPADAQVQELASNRILQHAGNTRSFNSVVRRVRAVAGLENHCAFNLRLALVAAAMDGQPQIDLDNAARSAGLLTHWRIAGPFGQYSNVDFERRFRPELDHLTHLQYASDALSSAAKKGSIDDTEKLTTERFWFRNGMLALPGYFSGSGVFYAAGEVEIPGSGPSQLEVLSAGTYAVFVDGKQALLHDERLAAVSSRSSAALKLGRGRHSIVVKFTADAAPISVALHPRFGSLAGKTALPKPLEKYVSELIAYFHGDLIAMERMLYAAPDKAASTQYLRALLYSAAEERSPRADAAWKSLAQAHPSAVMVRLKADEAALAHGQSEDAQTDVRSILTEHPGSEAAVQLAFTMSRSQSSAPALLARLIELHPSCAHLAEAIGFYDSAGEQDKAAKAEQQLAGCAPESLQYARILSESGRHGAAAACLQQLITKNPFHRAARQMLIEQLVLSGQQSAAYLQAKQLHELAPNSRRYALLAETPALVEDSRSERAAGFVEGKEFYVPYRRDGLELVRGSAQRRFSGGSSVTLLSDKVVQIGPEGEGSVYVHRIVRPLNKDGISRYGEVVLPRNAGLLELRTIKPSGQVIEPEISPQKTTISMPALEAGDAIEEEYVIPYPQVELAPDSALSLTFGSFDAPILYSRLVLLSPPENKLNIQEHAGAPQPLVGQTNGTVVRIWERENIAQTVAEPYLPPTLQLLPTVTISAAIKTRDRLRDQLMDATRIGLHVEEAVRELHLAPTASETDKARQLYRFVVAKLDSAGPDWAGNPAEDTLENGQGSRTAALLAMARAAGLKASLLMARKAGQGCSQERDLSCYTEPLVRFWFADGEVSDVDAEADDLPFGTILPAIEAHDALFVPLVPADVKKPEMMELAAKHGAEKTVAEAEISFQQNDLIAELTIRLGDARAQEIRSLLRNPGERQAFFEQLAMRIFAGATGVTGSSLHDDDPEQPLEILLHCTVPQFLNPQNGRLDIDQLAPALGLRAQYAKAPARKFPLYIESLFFESTTFHINLPANVQVVSLPKDFTEKSEFGEYSARFMRSAQGASIQRDFYVPVQVVAPEKYAAFAKFAGRIDEAERQRISLELGKDASAERQYRVPPATGMLR